MQRHWHASSFFGVCRGCEIRTLDCVRLGCAREINRRLREWKQSFRQTDQLHDVGSGSGLDHRLRIRESDVFGSENAQASRDVDRIGAAFDHSREPVERRRRRLSYATT